MPDHPMAALILAKMKGKGSAGEDEHPDHAAMEGFIDAVHAKDTDAALKWWNELCDGGEPDGDEPPPEE